MIIAVPKEIRPGETRVAWYARNRAQNAVLGI